MKLTSQILLQNGWVAGLQTEKIKSYCSKISEIAVHEYFTITFRRDKNTIELLYAPLLHYAYVNLCLQDLTVENFNKLLEICNLQEFKLHIDKPKKQQGWIVDLSKFNIKSEYFKTAKMLKTWFLGFVRNVYKDDVLRLNNLQFVHVQGGKPIAYFIFKADTQTFSKIYKIE